MKLIYGLAAVLLFITSCTVSKRVFDKEKFYDKTYDRYDNFLGAGEEKVHAWYQGLYSKNDTTFIERIFYPERKQITTLESFLVSNRDIKHGLHKKWTDHGILRSEGYYYNDLREGEWKYYHRTNGKLFSKGKFEKGKRTGVWLSYNANEWLEQEITWKDGEMEGPFTVYDSLGNTINSGTYKGDTIFQQTNPLEENDFLSLGEMPYLKEFEEIKNADERKIQSDRGLLKYIYTNINYPTLARENAVEGMAIIQFVVKKDGSIDDITALSGICEGIEKECIRIVKGLPAWNPGTLNGKPVNVSYNLPIRFKLN